MAGQRRERRFGGFTVCAAGSSESGIEEYRGQCEAEYAPGRASPRATACAPARGSRAEAALTEFENFLPRRADCPDNRDVEGVAGWRKKKSIWSRWMLAARRRAPS